MVPRLPIIKYSWQMDSGTWDINYFSKRSSQVPFSKKEQQGKSLNQILEKASVDQNLREEATQV